MRLLCLWLFCDVLNTGCAIGDTERAIFSPFSEFIKLLFKSGTSVILLILFFIVPILLCTKFVNDPILEIAISIVVY